MAKKIILLLRDAISFFIYILIYFRKRKGGIILLYHSVGYISPKNDPRKLNILPESFERHLKVISRYKGKVDIMFDDGYSNNFKYAFPLLRKYNFSATFFLITDFIDGKLQLPNFSEEGYKEPPLTWDEIKIMDEAGMKFGSHSKTHPRLTEISESELKRELVASKRCIEEILRHQIDNFAYPFGDAGSFNELTRNVLIESKYNYAYINIIGCNTRESDKFTLRRIRIYGEDGPFKLKMKMKGAYDWVDAIAIVKK